MQYEQDDELLERGWRGGQNDKESSVTCIALEEKKADFELFWRIKKKLIQGDHAKLSSVDKQAGQREKTRDKMTVVTCHSLLNQGVYVLNASSFY